MQQLTPPQQQEKPKFNIGDRVIGTKEKSKYAAKDLFIIGEIEYKRGKYYYSAQPLDGWKASDTFSIERHKSVQNIPENNLQIDNN